MANWRHKLCAFLDKCTILLALILTITTLLAFTNSVSAIHAQRNKTTVDNTTPNGDEKRMSDVFETLRERATYQQNLISAIVTITGLYAVILSFAAYFRFQQIKDDTKESLTENTKRIELSAESLERKFQDAKEKLSDLREEVRADIPAIHGMAKRLEDLLVELQTRLPIDGNWATLENVGKMSIALHEQALVDEMVINSLDIFDISKGTPTAKTVSRLFTSLGQFYFLKATYHHKKEQNDMFEAGFIRSKIYFDKATSFDNLNAIAWRSRGVAEMWGYNWRDSKIDDGKLLLSQAHNFIEKSLAIDPNEPGALDANSYILSIENNYSEAVEYCSRLIELDRTLTSQLRRKYIPNAYLQRGFYRALSLPYDKTQAEVAQLISEDLKEGHAIAKFFLSDAVFLLRLKSVTNDQRFRHLLEKSTVLQLTIANLVQS